MLRQAQRIQQELLMLFQRSEIYTFFRFLKTDKAHQVIRFGPDQGDTGPRTFFFSTTKVEKACRELAKCQNSLPLLLKRSGMDVKMLCKKELKISNWSVSHSTIGVYSSKEQIMQVWRKAEIANFLKCQSIFSKIYHALQSDSKYVHWTNIGTGFILSPNWPEYFVELLRHMRRNGFSTDNHPEVTHPLISRSAPIDAWLVVYLIGNIKDRAKRARTNERRKIQRQLLKKSSVTEKPICKKVMNKPCNSKQIEKELMPLKPIVQETKQPKPQQPKPQKPLLPQPLPQQPQSSKLNQFMVCTKQAIKYKAAELKTILSVIQKQDAKLRLGIIFSLLDEIIKVSRTGKIKQKKNSELVKVQQVVAEKQVLVEKQQIQIQKEVRKQDEPNYKSLSEQIMKMKQEILQLRKENKELKKRINTGHT